MTGPTHGGARCPAGLIAVPALAVMALLVVFSSACGQASGGQPPEAEVDARIVVAGDSIARELSGALGDAYARPGSQASFFLLPAIATASRSVDTAALLEADPDVVVVLVGTWEGIGVDTTVAGWEERYVAEVVAPFLEQVHEAGAEVLWLGYPAVDEPAEAARHERLNQVYAGLAERFDGVAFVDAGAAVEAADGTYTSSLPLPELGLTQVRALDGAHLCPAGVERMAQVVVDELAATSGIEADDGWARGAWRADPTGFEDPQDCVGVFDAPL